MTAPRARDRSAQAVLVLLLVTAVGLQAVRDRVAPPRGAEVPTLWMQSPDATRRVMLSFTDLAADVYWMRAVVHYGGERRLEGPDRFPLLYPLLDMATTLDIHFDVAARMGAIFLSEGYPGGPGRPDRAIQLLEKGLAAEPERWQYRHDIGFVHYWWRRDYPEAARQFQMASEIPKAPEWLQTMAAVTLTRGGDRASARRMWNEMLAEGGMEWMRRAAAYGLQQLQALDELDALNAAVASYQTTEPRTWTGLARAGVVPGIPVDPTGVPYDLNPEGRVVLGKASTLAPLPDIAATP